MDGHSSAQARVDGFEGYLKKKSDDLVGKAWKRCYCKYETESKLFMYWDTEADCTRGAPPKGAFILDRVEATEIETGTIIKKNIKPYGLKFYGHKLNESKVETAAYLDDKGQQLKWLQALRAATSTATEARELHRRDSGGPGAADDGGLLASSAKAQEQAELKKNVKTFDNNIAKALAVGEKTSAIMKSTNAELDRNREQLEKINQDLDDIEKIQEESGNILQQMAHPLTHHFSSNVEWAKRKKAQLLRQKMEMTKAGKGKGMVKQAAISRVALKNPELANKLKNSKNSDLANLSRCLSDMKELADYANKEIVESTEMIQRVQGRVQTATETMEQQQKLANKMTEKPSLWGI